MSLLDKININTHYTRSTNLERDFDSIEVAQSYIVTSKAHQILQGIVEKLGNKRVPRAWALIGPYGSGKSSFSVFLSNLLGDPEEEITQIAYKKLGDSDKGLSNAFKNNNKGTSGYLRVLLTGAPEPFSKKFVSALAEAVTLYWQGLRGPNHAIVKRLQKACKKREITHSEILILLTDLQKALLGKASGILLVIDEFGKFLEYEVRHGSNDIYLLQALAEKACERHEINILLFTLLHQSFEQYAKGLGDSLKQEWSKIQGRYESIPFLENVEQTLRVLSHAFIDNLTPTEKKQIEKQMRGTINILGAQSALPAGLNAQQALEIFAKCHPFHPVTALVLPMLCQKVAQNERTLFSYLGSQEAFGLKKLLGTMSELEEFIEPHHVYDYFIKNQPAALNDPVTHRRWSEVLTAIERLGDAPEVEINYLKTVGLLNIIGSQGGLKPSEPLMETLYGSKSKIIASNLVKKNVIQYRRYSSEYRVWQGSDFDIESSLQEELSRIYTFSLAEELNKNSRLLPIVARRYTIRNGCLRYFEPLFIDAETYKSISERSRIPRIIYYLASSKADEELFSSSVLRNVSSLDVVALYRNTPQLRDAVAEVLALERIRIHNQELNSDPVAQREFKDRLVAAEQRKSSILNTLTDEPELLEWFWSGEYREVGNKRDFQEMLSSILEKVYSKSPNFHNELINRDRPSSQAAAARNKLMAAMLTDFGKPDLGFDKFPPEKAIYRALLHKSKLHQETTQNEWTWVAPMSNKKSDDPCGIWPVWQKIVMFIQSTESQQKSFSELDPELVAPPYGVKAGVLPILYLAVYLTHQSEIAWYEDKAYIPYLTAEQLERFVKRPEEFSIQYFKIEGLKASIFSQYNEALYGVSGTEGKRGQNRTLLELVRPLAQFMGGLAFYTQKTKHLSPSAIALRQAFELSKSPIKLIFEDIPKALGFPALTAGDEEKIQGLAAKLTNVLRELKYAYSKFLERQQKLLAQAFEQKTDLTLSLLRRNIAGRVSGLDKYTIDIEGLRAFIGRLQRVDGEDSHWLENVLMYLGHKPTDKWLDVDQDQAEYRLLELARRVKDLERMRLHVEGEKTKRDSDFDVLLLRSLKKGGLDYDEVVTIDRYRADAIRHVKASINEALNGIEDRELRLAALADVVNNFLVEYRESQKIKVTTGKAGRGKKAS